MQYENRICVYKYLPLHVLLFLRQPANHKSKGIHPHSKTSSPGSYQGPAIPSRILTFSPPKKTRSRSEATILDPQDQVTDLFPFDRSFILEGFFGPVCWTGRLVKFFGSLVGWLRARLPRKGFWNPSLSVGEKKSSIDLGW